MSTFTETPSAAEIHTEQQALHPDIGMNEAQAVALDNLKIRWHGQVTDLANDGYGAILCWVGQPEGDRPGCMMIGIEKDGYTHS